MPKVLGKGQVVIPAKLRRRYGLLPGRLVRVEARAEGVLVKPARDVIDELFGKYRVPGRSATAELLKFRREEVTRDERDYRQHVKRQRRAR